MKYKLTLENLNDNKVIGCELDDFILEDLDKHGSSLVDSLKALVTILNKNEQETGQAA